MTWPAEAYDVWKLREPADGDAGDCHACGAMIPHNQAPHLERECRECGEDLLAGPEAEYEYDPDDHLGAEPPLGWEP